MKTHNCQAPVSADEGRALFIGIRRTHRGPTALLAGPFTTRDAAHAALPTVEAMALEVDAYSWSYYWGCVIAPSDARTVFAL